MKGKRYTTEDKIRGRREADRGKSILEVCREHNMSEVSFHRWKRQFDQVDISEARTLKDLKRGERRVEKDARPSRCSRTESWRPSLRKMVSPAHRRAAAHAVVARGLCSGRMACRFLLLARATFLYRGRPPSAKQTRLAKRLWARTSDCWIRRNTPMLSPQAKTRIS